MSDNIMIRDARPGDLEHWQGLWAGYNAFYHNDLQPGITAFTWQRILDDASPVNCRVAECEGRLTGFATTVVHENTWTLTPVCYLEDLFVDPAFRGRGIGRRLINDLVAKVKQNGWSRLYWHTHQGNPARRLYDEFTAADDFVRYTL